jgi:hypothetical protein
LFSISGLLTSIGKTSREALISKEPKKICSEVKRKFKMQQSLSKIKWDDNLEKGNINALYFGFRTEIKN